MLRWAAVRDSLAFLVQLQHLDDRLAALERRLGSLPAELQERGARAAALAAAAEDLERQRKGALLRAQELENDVRDHEARLRKLEAQGRQMRDAGALVILQHEAQELRDRIAKEEEEGLLLLERAEELVPERDRAQARAREAAAELDQFRSAVAADEEQLAAERSVQQSARAALLRQLPEEARELYEKLLQARRGKAVAPLRGESCSGCGMVVPPNDRLRVLAMHEVACCRSCSRILVTAELWAPQPAQADSAPDAE